MGSRETSGLPAGLPPRKNSAYARLLIIPPVTITLESAHLAGLQHAFSPGRHNKRDGPFYQESLMSMEDLLAERQRRMPKNPTPEDLSRDLDDQILLGQSGARILQESRTSGATSGVLEPSAQRAMASEISVFIKKDPIASAICSEDPQLAFGAFLLLRQFEDLQAGRETAPLLSELERLSVYR